MANKERADRKNQRHFCTGTAEARPPEHSSATRRQTRLPWVVHVRAQCGAAAPCAAHWSKRWGGATRAGARHAPQDGVGEDPPGATRRGVPWGTLGGGSYDKAALLDDVRQRFPRHRAFQAELQATMRRMGA